MWKYYKNINTSLVRPQYQAYRCKNKECTCSIPEMCKGRWRRYQKDLMKHIHLKFKDTYKNGD